MTEAKYELTKEEKTLRAKWCEALRSGKYKQGTGVLRRNDKFCCLGVLCDLVNPAGWEVLRSYDGSTTYRFEQSSAFISSKLMGSVGLNETEAVNLTRINDQAPLHPENDFKCIAAKLESGEVIK